MMEMILTVRVLSVAQTGNSFARSLFIKYQY